MNVNKNDRYLLYENEIDGNNFKLFVRQKFFFHCYESICWVYNPIRVLLYHLYQFIFAFKIKYKIRLK